MTTTHNPAGAAERLAAMRNISPGLCLLHVTQATLEGAAHPLKAGTAWESWEQNTLKHPDVSGPRDYPVYFTFENFGDVAISCGDGTVIGTRGTAVVHQTIAEREAQLGGRLLGWSGNLLGVELVVPGAKPKPKPPTPGIEYYTVVRGDTLTNIAHRHGITLARLEAMNPQIKNPNLIYPGEKIRVR